MTPDRKNGPFCLFISKKDAMKITDTSQLLPCSQLTRSLLFSDDEKFELCTINPGLILGPILHGSNCTSMEVRIIFFTPPPPPLCNPFTRINRSNSVTVLLTRVPTNFCQCQQPRQHWSGFFNQRRVTMLQAFTAEIVQKLTWFRC